MNFEILNKFLATLTLIGDIGLVLFLIASIVMFAFSIKCKSFEALMAFASKHILLFGFLITLFGSVCSLFYSEVVQLPPCSLCWYQRLFLFPQAILFGIAYARKDKNILHYTLPLTIIGALIAAYHVFVQMGFGLPVPCSVNSLVSCATKDFEYFGYITIPMMSLTAFAGLLTLQVIGKKKS